MKKLIDEKNLHVAFEVSLALKGVFALGELITGIFAYVATRKFLFDLMQVITRAELTEDPRDFVANTLLQASRNLSVSGRHFIAFYLFSHGAIKLWLAIGLWRAKPGYYPTAVVVFGLFMLYQLYRYSFTHSLLLLLMTALDGVVIGLIWIEYRHLRHMSFDGQK